LWIAAVFLALQAIAFVALARRVVAMAQGGPTDVVRERESPWLVAPPVVLLGLVLVLGLFLGGPVQRVLAMAAITLGGSAP
jgi:hydrogenase-4 component F